MWTQPSGPIGFTDRQIADKQSTACRDKPEQDQEPVTQNAVVDSIRRLLKGQWQSSTPAVVVLYSLSSWNEQTHHALSHKLEYILRATFLPMLDYGLLYSIASIHSLKMLDTVHHCILSLSTACFSSLAVHIIQHTTDCTPCWSWEAFPPCIRSRRTQYCLSLIHKTLIGLAPAYLSTYLIRTEGDYGQQSQDLLFLVSRHNWGEQKKIQVCFISHGGSVLNLKCQFRPKDKSQTLVSGYSLWLFCLVGKKDEQIRLKV